MDSFVIDRGAVESFHQKKTIVPNLLVIHFPPHVQSSLARCIVVLLLTMIVFREAKHLKHWEDISECPKFNILMDKGSHHERSF